MRWRKQFSISDNFYMEPEASGVGHRWLVGVQPDNFCQMLYTLGWSFKLGSTAPGRRASFGSNGSLAPEDYPEAARCGSISPTPACPSATTAKASRFAGVGEDEDERRTGAREVINMPMSKVLYDNTCREFPIFNMNIPISTAPTGSSRTSLASSSRSPRGRPERPPVSRSPTRRSRPPR